MTSSPFVVGGAYKLRNGLAAMVVARLATHGNFPLLLVVTDKKGLQFTEMVTDTGAYHNFVDPDPSPFDLMPPEKAVYLNVYQDADEGWLYTGVPVDNRAEADELGDYDDGGDPRVGCLRIVLAHRFDA